LTIVTLRDFRYWVAALLIATIVGLSASGSAAAAAQLRYYGGEVANNPTVYLTFWGKNWNQYSGARTEIREMFAHLSGSGWQGILTQYYDTSGPISSNVGFSSWTDESIAAPNSVNNEHVQDEIQYALAQRGWPGAGVDNIYMVLPAPGSKYAYVEGCGVHHWSSRLNAPYAIVGWPEAGPMEGCADHDPSGQKRSFVGASMSASHEYSEAVTDPLGASTGWSTASGIEIADLCFETYGGQLPAGGWVEEIWDNSQAACAFSGPVSASWHNDNLGGTLTADPDISAWEPNRLDVFSRGTEGSLWTKYFSSPTWSSWINLGGSITGGPGAVASATGRIDVVARLANNSIEHRWFDGSWHSYNLGGSLTSDPDIASWGSGRLDVFARGPEGALWTKYFNGSVWSSWINLGGSIVGGPAAVAMSPGRLDVVARRASDNSIEHWWFDGSWHSDNLGGSLTSDPGISSWGSGRLDVFARGSEGALLTKYFSGYAWSSWINLGGSIVGGPGAVASDIGRIHVVARRASDNSIEHWWFSP
jgi:hypothetical protein